jgi:hypothetical protein
MAAGTGTAGANQNGALVAPAYTPGEIVTAAGPLSINASARQSTSPSVRSSLPRRTTLPFTRLCARN